MFLCLYSRSLNPDKKHKFDVDLSKPTDHGNILVSAIGRTKVNGYYRDGLQFEIPNVKRRDIEEGHYAAWIIPNSTSILFQMPTMPDSMKADRDERMKCETKLGVYNEEAAGGREVLKNNIIDNFPNKYQVLNLPAYADTRHFTKDDKYDDGSSRLKVYGGLSEEIVQEGSIADGIPYIIDQTYNVFFRVYFEDDNAELVERSEYGSGKFTDGADMLSKLIG